MSTKDASINGMIGHLNPLHYFDLLIDTMRNLPVEERKHINTTVPDPLDFVQIALKAIRDYHIRTLKFGSEASDDLKIACAEYLKPLFPSSCCFIINGDSIRVGLFGNSVKVIAFIAIQIFHAIPYILSAALITGTVFLYQTAPITLGAGVAGSLLAIQVYYIFRLVKEIEVTNQILDQRLDEISRRFDVVLLIKNTGNSTWDMTKRVLRTVAGFFGGDLKHPTVGQ